MKTIVSGTDMKKVDQHTIQEVGIPSLVLMERAAYSVFQVIKENEKKNESIMVVASVGNNGADGLAIGRMLFLDGYNICIYVLGNVEKASEEFQTQWKICKKLNVPFVKQMKNVDVIVDAVFGVGLSRDVSGEFAKVIEEINQSKARVYAVDIPSGIDADNGTVRGVAVKANATITFGSQKIGTVMYPGADYCGKVMVADIGFPKNAYDAVEKKYYLEENDLRRIPKRPNYSNKGTFGKILVIAGSRDIAGAAYLCAKAAFRCGAGMLRILTAKENKEFLNRMLPEAMVNVYDTKLFDAQIVKSALHWSDVVVVGPGIDVGIIQEEILGMVLDSKLPTVVDADGINLMAENERLKDKLHKEVILTPHLAEMSRFSKKSIPEISNHLLETAKWATKEFGVACVLKDARTVISTEELVAVNLSGNNGMATAGSGDVLAGILAGLIGLGVPVRDAAVLAPYVHGLAGEIAAEKHGKSGMMAGDIIESMKYIFK
ncbi:MAG: NAD(P)H-hydrate dehydratase [Eubacterium sp.]|nr:NAD(P)H-hydrate dehydratase [Eubacterium sp.]